MAGSLTAQADNFIACAESDFSSPRRRNWRHRQTMATARMPYSASLHARRYEVIMRAYCLLLRDFNSCM